MIKTLKSLVILTLITFSFGCTDESSVTEEQSRIKLLWKNTVSPYTKLNLWEQSRIYDAGHVLMLPMEYAFKIAPNRVMQSDFDKLFNSYLINYESASSNDFYRFQFNYAALRYLNYIPNNSWTAENKLLFEKIRNDFFYVWYEKEQSNHGIFGKGREEIVLWKYNNKGNVDRNFKRATIDLEFYGFAIIAEIINISNSIGLEVDEMLNESLSIATQVFKQEVEYTSTGWLYQPGQWQDNIDYLYAGHYIAEPNLSYSMIEGIATDSSHSHRLPLWLTSLRNAYKENTEYYLYFDGLLQGFKEQFITVVFQPSDSDFFGPRLTNYMDGHNGIYRYKYHDDPDLKLGYEAFNLSGTLFVSFYPFLYDERIASEFGQLTFPLPQESIELYQGLGPTKNHDDLISFPNYFHNGYAELYSLIASKMF